MLGGLPVGTRVAGWDVLAVTGMPSGARLDLASGGRLLHVLVLPHGSLPVAPPATTRDFDVLYETGHPGESAPSAADVEPIVQAVADAIRARE